MTFFRCQDDDILFSLPRKLDMGRRRKYFPEFARDLFGVDISTKLSSHEEGVGFFFYEFTVADNVEFVPEEDSGDVVDEAFAVLAGDDKNVLHRLSYCKIVITELLVSDSHRDGFSFVRQDGLTCSFGRLQGHACARRYGRQAGWAPHCPSRPGPYHHLRETLRRAPIQVFFDCVSFAVFTGVHQ